MSRTFVQPGDTIDAIAPAGGVKSNDPILLGALFGVAEVDAAEGETYALTLVGVHRLPKATGSALEPGTLACWTPSPGSVSGSGGVLIGAVVEHASSDATSVLVRLNGIATAAAA